jgi:osmotically-inducible protein OsmY
MKKTNSQLQHDVQEELRWEPSLDAAAIGVAAHEGVVTLTGHADSYRDKLTAEQAAKRVSGVRGLANDLAVKLPSTSRRDDTDLAEAAVHALTWSVPVPDDRIKATVKEGFVTLEGEVDWNYQREVAYREVKKLTGVKGVLNNVTVRPRSTPAEIKTRIEAAFQRSARTDARGIRVETDGGKITLRGSVTSWAEHDDAARARRPVDGLVRQR